LEKLSLQIRGRQEQETRQVTINSAVCHSWTDITF